MSRTSEELSIIPRGAWIIAAVIYVGITTPLFFYALPSDPTMGQWPRLGQALFVYGLMLFLFPIIGLFGYVYADAKRRAMRPVMWLLLSIFIPNMIGVILYFILRSPMPKACPGCAKMLKSGYGFCPHCGTTLLPTCPNCGKSVEPGWANCPYCGQKLPAIASRVA